MILLWMDLQVLRYIDIFQKPRLLQSLFKAILRKMGMEREQFEKDMSQYSAGQKKKALLAKSLCERAHLYIWDEPLNYRLKAPLRDAFYHPSTIFVATLS